MRCKHFGTCGGCSLQNIPYKDQLINKQKFVATLLEPFLINNCTVLRNIISSPEIWFYRNKMEYVFGLSGSKISLGLRMKNKFNKVVNVEECYLFCQEGNKLLSLCCSWAEKNALSVYNLRSQKGCLRYLVLRKSKAFNKLMVNLITNSAAMNELYSPWERTDTIPAKILSLKDELTSHCPSVSTFLWSENSSKADLAIGEKINILSGDGTLQEKIYNFIFTISPYSFFQINISATEELCKIVSSFVEDTGSNLLDLYCGTGLFGIYLANKCSKVIGVENNPQAIKDATTNAQQNKITNCEFVCENVETFIDKIANSQFHTNLSTIIVDPPRAGIHKKALRSIITLNPRVIVYVSCNPKMLFNDLQNLTKFYTISAVQPIDLFPHTEHIEIVVKLVHK